MYQSATATKVDKTSMLSLGTRADTKAKLMLDIKVKLVEDIRANKKETLYKALS